MVAGLHVRATGRRKTFYLYYRTRDGQERRPKLDHYGNITLAQARDAAREMRVQIAAGRDPVAERAKSKSEPTVSEFFERMFVEHWSRRRTAADVRRLFDRHVAPRIGGARMQAVGHDDIARIHAALSDTPYQANRVLALVTRLFNLAAWPRYAVRVPGDNPCRGVERFAELKRRRKAEPAELAALGPLLQSAAENRINVPSVAFLFLLAYSGARPSEIAKATWDRLARTEIDGKVYGVLTIDDGKTGQITVHLPPQAMAIIERLPRVAGRTITGIRSPRKLWERIRREAGCPDLRLRDLRRTFASVSYSAGHGATVGELLNHRSAQTTKVYAKLYGGAAASAAESTAAKVDEMLTLRRP